MVKSTFQAIVVPGPLYSVTYLLRPGTSKLKVPLVDNFATGSSLVIAKIDLGRRDGWKGIGRGEGRELSVYSATLRGTLKHRGVRFVLVKSQQLRVRSQRDPFRGLVSRFPVFFGLVAGATFFFISSSCLAILLLPMVYWTGRPKPEDLSPVRSNFSPKRESKSPGPPKPRSRVRYEDDEKKLRRQRQYTAGGAGSSRSRSSKSSRRSLVRPPCISTNYTLLTNTLVQQRRSATGRRTHRLWKHNTSEKGITAIVRTGLGGRMRQLVGGGVLYFSPYISCKFPMYYRIKARLSAPVRSMPASVISSLPGVGSHQLPCGLDAGLIGA